jgi:hypothetical protein
MNVFIRILIVKHNRLGVYDLQQNVLR